ncbi:MAG: glucose 1-dehydrogenase [Thermoleophilaceae bacterium]|jgi:glucose 1-dehydrogenase|nr:glucose 1-dehydrogenase [Thermoleophilaceae bacterium]
MDGIRDKKVLVTGGSSGIGQAIAVRFAKHGADVAINYLTTPDEAAETEKMVEDCIRQVHDAGVQDLLVQGDVSKQDDCVRMVQETVDGLGGLDILVNNAGIQISKPSDQLDEASFQKVLDVNLKGSFLCAREAIKRFLEHEPGDTVDSNGNPVARGVIVNISSVHEMIPKPDYLGYSVSKGGMHNLTRTLALEYAAQNIRVNAVGPGATITPINRAWIDDPQKKEQVESHIPMGRAGTADEMAGVTTFLASDDAAYITGQTVFVDGGLTLYPDFREPWSSE